MGNINLRRLDHIDTLLPLPEIGYKAALGRRPMRGLGELVEIEGGGEMRYPVDLVPGIIPQHSDPPAHGSHRFLKPLYIPLVGIYFLLACVARVLPT